MKIKQLLLSLLMVFPAFGKPVEQTVQASRFSHHLTTALAIGAAITFWTMHDQRHKRFILGIRDRKKLGAASLGCIVGSVALDELFPKGKHAYRVKPVLQGLLMGYGAIGLKKAIADEQPNEQNQNRRPGRWHIDYNNIRLWQVLGAGGLINKYVSHLQGRKYSSDDIFMTSLCWYFLDI